MPERLKTSGMAEIVGDVVDSANSYEFPRGLQWTIDEFTEKILSYSQQNESDCSPEKAFAIAQRYVRFALRDVFGKQVDTMSGTEIDLLLEPEDVRIRVQARMFKLINMEANAIGMDLLETILDGRIARNDLRPPRKLYHQLLNWSPEGNPAFLNAEANNGHAQQFWVPSPVLEPGTHNVR
jgi:hypothetical protein